MTSITVLYGTTSANQAIPVLVDDAGQVVIDGGGTPGDSYWTLDGSTISTVYAIQGPGATWSFDEEGKGYVSNELTFGEFGDTFAGKLTYSGSGIFGNGGDVSNPSTTNTWCFIAKNGYLRIKSATEGDNAQVSTASAFSCTWGEKATSSIRQDGTIYCKTVVDEGGYDFQKIGTALSTLHDVVESVDDLQGLKNLLKLVLDNLKSDIPPDSDESE